jgi:hypothetical protein
VYWLVHGKRALVKIVGLFVSWMVGWRAVQRTNRQTIFILGVLPLAESISLEKPGRRVWSDFISDEINGKIRPVNFACVSGRFGA